MYYFVLGGYLMYYFVLGSEKRASLSILYTTAHVSTHSIVYPLGFNTQYVDTCAVLCNTKCDLCARVYATIISSLLHMGIRNLIHGVLSCILSLLSSNDKMTN